MTPEDPQPELTSRFGDYLSEAGSSDWQALHESLAVGAPVSGTVVFRNSFGVYLDVGFRFPAVLLATRLVPFPESPDSLPPVGRSLTASVLRFSDSTRQIVLQQP